MFAKQRYKKNITFVVMKRLVTAIIIFLLSFEVFAMYEPSDSARFSLLVCSPGNVIYSTFGHAALRLKDEPQDVDIVFDYGVFSFDDLPRFIRNFIIGEMYYLLDARTFHMTTWQYQYEGRGIIEYKLNLSPEERKKISDFLIWNMQPENQAYLYNFFEDNCSTRLATILNSQTNNCKLNVNTFEPKTWRELIIDYAGEKSWISYGIHLGLGYPADTTMNGSQMLFIPDYLGYAVQNTMSNAGKLSNDGETILEATTEIQSAWWDNSILFLWILAGIILAISVFEITKKRWCVWCDFLLYFFLGIFGCLIWIISFCSIHSLVFPNFNTLWITPFHLLFSILLLFPSLQRWSRWYVPFSAAMVLIYVAITNMVGQFIPTASWPLFLIIIIRAIRFAILSPEFKKQ